MQKAEYNKKNTRYQLLLVFFYAITLICWFFVIYYRFFSGVDYTDSYVITSYLVEGQKLYQSDVNSTFLLTFVDIFVKANLVIFSWVLGTIFVLFRILPAIKRLNYVLMILSFVFAYIPSLFSIASFLSNFGEYSYVTFREFLLLIVMYPLNFAVFFYFYYLLDLLLLQKKEA